eukprot:4885880-Amphidinium_carterae.1
MGACPPDMDLLGPSFLRELAVHATGSAEGALEWAQGHQDDDPHSSKMGVGSALRTSIKPSLRSGWGYQGLLLLVAVHSACAPCLA